LIIRNLRDHVDQCGEQSNDRRTVDFLIWFNGTGNEEEMGMDVASGSLKVKSL